MTDTVTPVSNTGSNPGQYPPKDKQTKPDNKGTSSGAVNTPDTDKGDQPLNDSGPGQIVNTIV